MRIASLTLGNFKQYEQQTIELNPQFTLFIGENGSGKTSILEALAVAASIWLVDPPDSSLINSGRNISPQEIRLREERRGDRTTFREMRPVVVAVTGELMPGVPATWTRQIREGGRRTTNADAKAALAQIKALFREDEAGVLVPFPVVAFYGAGRAWLPSNERTPKAKPSERSRRWAAFYDCFSERIRLSEIHTWFKNEAIERSNNGGEWRQGFKAVRQAVLNCVPDAHDVWFDPDRDQLVLALGGEVLPFGNLSAGQHMMLAMVADLAIRMVKQNSFLLDPSINPTVYGSYAVLEATPGLVLIDEVDVHLHPRWQRRVVADLRRTFPNVQFVCTTHSPQVIGEVQPEEIVVLSERSSGRPQHSFGLNSDRVLALVMGAADRDPEVKKQLQDVYALVDKEDLVNARVAVQKLNNTLGENDPDLVHARTLITLLEPGEDGIANHHEAE